MEWLSLVIDLGHSLSYENFFSVHINSIISVDIRERLKLLLNIKYQLIIKWS